jgi:xanthine/CO dehydrogenase XdhC/CoxF family maturation factor
VRGQAVAPSGRLLVLMRQGGVRRIVGGGSFGTDVLSDLFALLPILRTSAPVEYGQDDEFPFFY